MVFSARERSVHAQDSSWLLDSLISDLTLNGLLAEFQYSYVTFVIGQVGFCLFVIIIYLNVGYGFVRPMEAATARVLLV